MTGRVTTNSVNTSTALSTEIVPPCAFVTMSQACPVGLVVKNNGWNSLSRISVEMPAPLSRTRISTVSQTARVVTFRVSAKPGRAALVFQHGLHDTVHVTILRTRLVATNAMSPKPTTAIEAGSGMLAVSNSSVALNSVKRPTPHVEPMQSIPAVVG
jgi:hypothetical protein